MRFEVIVITLEKDSPKEVKVIDQLFKTGLKALHLRKPTSGINELRAYIKDIPKQFHKRIVVHSHYELVKEFNLKGVHLTEKARTQTKELTKLKREGVKIISASFHKYEDVLKSRRKYDYVFLSPVFDSISKQGYKGKFDLKDLGLFLKGNKNKIVALGGISDNTISIVKQIGFSGAASLGYVWESKNPVKTYKRLLSKIK